MSRKTDRGETRVAQPDPHQHHDHHDPHRHDVDATAAPAAGRTAHGHADHGGHAGHGDHVVRFRQLFWWNLILAVPVVGFSMMFAMLLGYRLPDQPWVGWVSPVVGTVSTCGAARRS